MNKLTKFLGFVGLSSIVAYAAFGLKGKSIQNPDGTQKSNRQSNTQKSNSKNSSEYSDSRTQKMYKDLGMTDEQKRKYERDYKTVMGTWEKDNPNYEMNDQQKIDEHNSVLSAVLNEDQYGIYRDWFKNNPA